MKSHRKKALNADLITRVVCAVVFLVFAVSWLHCFQGDMLAVAQHGLSEGKTSYDHASGTLIITLILIVVNIVVMVLTRLSNAVHALIYLPSFLLLAFISAISSPFRWGAWLWVAPIVLGLWVAAVIVCRKATIIVASPEDPGRLARCLWVNMLQMAVMTCGVAWVADTNAVTHYKAHAEMALQHGDADEALHTGHRSLETDESLTMLRILALSEKGRLADALFDYAIAGSSADMLPGLKGSRSRLLMMSDSLVWQHFGVHPDSLRLHADSLTRAAVSCPYTLRQYLDSVERHDTIPLHSGHPIPPYADYRLMALLIDRQIDTFAVCLPRYYTIRADSLPRHYREAMVLRQHLLGDTLFLYRDSIMADSLNRFLRYDSIYPERNERKIRTEEDYGNTYWYYYFE